MYQNILFGLVMLFSSQGLIAQGYIQRINLETLLQLAGANNLTIKEYKQKQKLALADLDKAREWWLPDIYAGTTVNQLNGSTMNGDGQFFTDVNSQNFWGGIGINASWDFGEGIFIEKAEKLRAHTKEYLVAVERNHVLLRIIEVYYDFLVAELHYRAYERLVAQNDTLTQQMSIQVEAGMRYESELLLEQSNQSHLKVEMMKAKMVYRTKSVSLLRLLNFSPNIVLICTDTLLAPLELPTQLKSLAVNDLVYSNRPEFQAASLMLQSVKAKKRTTTTAFWLPELRLGIYASMFGDVILPLYFTEALSASLMWKIPLGRITYGGELAQYNSRIAIQKTKLEQVKAIVNEEVLSALETVNIAQEQIEIAKQGVKLATKAISQSMERQQLGIVLPFELLQMQEAYIKSRLDYLNAVATYNKAQYRLFVAVGNDL